MTPMPPVRYDISSLEVIANRKPPPGVLERMDPLTRVLMGTDGSGMGWAATQDFDGQIEISFSYRHKRPNNWEVQRFLALAGMSYVQEESKKVGKLRHFVVQVGVKQ